MRARAGAICLFVFLAALWCRYTPQLAYAAEERILSFHADINISPGGSLYVVETIRYTVGTSDFPRGFFREISIAESAEQGSDRPKHLRIVSVKRDNISTRYLVSELERYSSVVIDPRENVRPPASSEQIYEIIYRAKGHVLASDGYDQFSWNVTGGHWTFPIEHASVTVSLPDDTLILRHSAVAGHPLSEGNRHEVSEVNDGRLSSKTTAQLLPGESLRITIAWPKGLIATGSPPGATTLEYGRFAAYTATLVGIMALFLCWLFVGRDPRKGVIYPEFEPPKGIGPAAARYLRYQMFDDRCLTAAIISMAVKGALRIVEKPSATGHQGQSYWLQPFGPSCKPLTPGERAAYFALFPNAQSLELVADKTNGRRMDDARAALRAKLGQELYGASLRRNTFYTLAGISVGILTAFFMMLPATATGESLSELLAIWLVAFVTGLLIGLCAALMAGAFGAERFVNRYGALMLRGLFVLNMIVHMIIWNSISSPDLMDPGILGSGVAFGLLSIVFLVLMEAPTKAARRLLDRIEGFALYLTVAETVRLNLLNPSEPTPELFERFLPYAIALDVAHEWSERFGDILSTIGEPDWHQRNTEANGGVLERLYADKRAFEHSFGRAVSSTSVASSRPNGSDSRGDENW